MTAVTMQGLLKQKITFGKEYITTITSDHALLSQTRRSAANVIPTQSGDRPDSAANGSHATQKISILALYRYDTLLGFALHYLENQACFL